MPCCAARSALRDELVRVVSVAEETVGEFLEGKCPAFAVSGTKKLHQVDDFVFEDPLQRLQTVCARNTGDADPGIVVGEAVEENLG